MKTSQQWYEYFQGNLKNERIDWKILPTIKLEELMPVLSGIQAWQLGETSDGKNLVRASTKYAKKIDDPFYVSAVRLFIKEEQKHGNNLGKYLDAIGQPRIKNDWGDSLFRRVRYFNTSMELWTLTVITVESTAQVFYQSLKDATQCKLLKQICTDILIDEAPHISFQMERLQVIYDAKSKLNKTITFYVYKLFYFLTILVVWYAHKKVFKEGGNSFGKYLKLMSHKFGKTLARIGQNPILKQGASLSTLHQKQYFK